jgi:hypothetical protein
MKRNLQSSLGLVTVMGLAALLAFAAVPHTVEPATAAAQAPAKPELPIELQYVPADAALFISVDSAKVWDNPILKAIRKTDANVFDALSSATKTAFNLTPDDLRSVVLFIPKLQLGMGPDGFGVVVTFRKDYDKDKLAKGAEMLLPKGANVHVERVSNRTAVVLVNLGEEFARPQSAEKSGPLTEALQAAATGKHTAVMGMTLANYPDILRSDDLPVQLRPFQPLFKAVAITGTLDLGKSLDFDVRVKTTTAGQAINCEKSLASLLALIEEELSDELKSLGIEAADKASIKDLAVTMKAASAAIKGAKFTTLGNETRLTASIPTDLPFASAYFAAKERVESAKAIQTSENNLKQIGLASLNYESTYGKMPPAAVCDKTGKPLLSWRVLVLPYLEENELFKEFKLDEAWDSDHNKKLLARMPKVYSIPGKTNLLGTDTYYRVFVGNNAGFEWIQGLKITDFTDGTSNTLLCVVAAEAVPWTKPDELEFDPEKDMRKLLGTVNGKVQVGLVDGSVHSLKKMPSKETLHALITRNGGEVIGADFP